MAHSLGVQPEPAEPVPPVAERQAWFPNPVFPEQPGPVAVPSEPAVPPAPSPAPQPAPQPAPPSRARRARRITPDSQPVEAQAPESEPVESQAPESEWVESQPFETASQAPTGRHAAPLSSPPLLLPTFQSADFRSPELVEPPSVDPADPGALRAEGPFTTNDLVELMRADAPPRGRPHDHEAVDHVARYAEQAELARSLRTDTGGPTEPTIEVPTHEVVEHGAEAPAERTERGAAAQPERVERGAEAHHERVERGAEAHHEVVERGAAARSERVERVPEARSEQVERARVERGVEARRGRVERAWVERERRVIAVAEEQGRVEHVARVLSEVELPYTALPLKQEPQLWFTGQLLTVKADDAPVAYRHQQVERRQAARSGRHSASQRSVVRPVSTITWLALAALLGLGVLMLQRTQALWMQIAGFLLLLLLVPASGFVVARGIKRGFGSIAAVSIAALFFVLAALRLSYFF